MTDQPQPAGNPKRRGLLIGINKYPQLSQLRWLHGCVNDILGVRSLLVEHAGFAQEDVRLLLSEVDGRTLPADIGQVEAPDAATIRAALAALSEGIGPGDEVVLYYSGHGVRIANPQNPAEQIGAVTAMDVHFTNGQLAPETLIVNRELNGAIQSALATGATVTAVLDSCHSGGATRDLDDTLVRELVVPDVTPETWEQLVSYHRLAGSDLAQESDRALSGSGWATSLGDQKNLIVLSGCRDVETSKEYPRDQRLNGALTYFLLDTLKNVPAGATEQTTWQDLYPHVRQAVAAAYPDQTPTLEGRGERPLFGGAWSPYAPGFTVTLGAGGALQISGGTMHGLGPGAQLALYPPRTADFKTVSQVTVVQIDSAELITSEGHVVDGSADVAEGSRARLIKPAPTAAPLGVQLTEVPEDVEKGIRQVEGIDGFVCLNPAQTRPEFEVRPNPDKAAGGWVLAPYVSGVEPPSPNAIIASTPGLDSAEPEAIGAALGLGLIHWAKYWAVLTRRNTDSTLQGAVSLTLLAGRDARAMAQNPNDPANAWPVTPDASGACQVTEPTPLMVKVKISANAPGRLFTALLLCDNGGSIRLLWPPPSADNFLDPGQEKVAGYGASLGAFNLDINRADQTEGLFTIKAIATNVDGQVDLSSLEQVDLVQDIIDAQFGRGIREASKASSPQALWTTVELPVVVKRAN